MTQFTCLDKLLLFKVIVVDVVVVVVVTTIFLAISSFHSLLLLCCKTFRLSFAKCVLFLRDSLNYLNCLLLLFAAFVAVIAVEMLLLMLLLMMMRVWGQVYLYPENYLLFFYSSDSPFNLKQWTFKRWSTHSTDVSPLLYQNYQMITRRLSADLFELIQL